MEYNLKIWREFLIANHRMFKVREIRRDLYLPNEVVFFKTPTQLVKLLTSMALQSDWHQYSIPYKFLLSNIIITEEFFDLLAKTSSITIPLIIIDIYRHRGENIEIDGRLQNLLIKVINRFTSVCRNITILLLIDSHIDINYIDDYGKCAYDYFRLRVVDNPEYFNDYFDTADYTRVDYVKALYSKYLSNTKDIVFAIFEGLAPVWSYNHHRFHQHDITFNDRVCTIFCLKQINTCWNSLPMELLEMILYHCK